jgi:hypothetical protein
MENNIFKLIDFTLKKKKIDDSNLEIKNFYLLNRWLSMCDVNICLIINSITNRWILKNNEIDILKFYRAFLPKNCKPISYIKKKIQNKELKNTDLNKIANNFELSIREIELYEEMVDFLNKKNN